MATIEPEHDLCPIVALQSHTYLNKEFNNLSLKAHSHYQGAF